VTRLLPPWYDLCAAAIGLVVLALTMPFLTDRARWLMVLGVLALVVIFVRSLRWGAGIVGLLALIGMSTRGAEDTALVVGILLVLFAFLLDLGDEGQQDGELALGRWWLTVVPIVAVATLAGVTAELAQLVHGSIWVAAAGPLFIVFAWLVAFPGLTATTRRRRGYPPSLG
jgi:hypothetical protein